MDFNRVSAGVAIRRLPILRGLCIQAATFALVLLFSAVGVHMAAAQNLVTISPDQSVGPVPDGPGTGLFGLYYLDPAGGAELTASYGQPLASFTTTNLCFPDCHSGNIFDDNSGGLALFTNGNATNITNLTTNPLPGNWNSAALFMTGALAITQPGTYDFTIQTDNDSELIIGGNFVGGVQGCCGPVSAFANFSEPGLYPILFGFVEYGGASGLDFIAKDPSGACYFGCDDGNGNLQPNSFFYAPGDLQGAPAPIPGTGWPSALVMLGGLAAFRLRKVRDGRRALRL